MNFEKLPEPTSKELVNTEKERAQSDTELLRGGAEYQVDEKGRRTLEITAEQKQKAYDEMVDSKINKLTHDESWLFIAEQQSAKALSKLDSLVHEGKIDEETKSDLARSIEMIREQARFAFREKLGEEKTEEIADLNIDNFQKGIREDIKNAGDLDELLGVVARSGGFKGTKEFFNAKETRKIIDEVRSEKGDVTRLSRDQGLRKKVNELLAIEKEQDAALAEQIANASGFDDLFKVLETAGGVCGSAGFRGAEDLIKEINETRIGCKKWKAVFWPHTTKFTRRAGLRDKITQLLEKEVKEQAV